MLQQSDKMRMLSRYLGVVSATVSGYVLGCYFGFGSALNLTGVQYPIIEGLGWVSGLNPYSLYFDRQRTVVFCLLLFLIGNLLRKPILKHTTCLIASVVALLQILQVLADKVRFWSESDVYLGLAREMFWCELVVAGIVAVLALLEVAMITQTISERRVKI